MVSLRLGYKTENLEPLEEPEMKRTLSISWNRETEVFEIIVTEDTFLRKEPTVVFQGKSWMEIINALTRNDWASDAGMQLTVAGWLAQ